MILIRLKRRSSKNNLTYAVVVTSDKFTPKGSQFLDNLGYYKPIVDRWSNKYLFVDFDRLKFWVERGARINSSLFVLMRAWFSFKYTSQMRSEIRSGEVLFYMPDTKQILSVK